MIIIIVKIMIIIVIMIIKVMCSPSPWSGRPGPAAVGLMEGGGVKHSLEDIPPHISKSSAEPQ